MKKTFIKALRTSIDEENYTIECIMTAEVEDRYGEIVDIDTMSVENFMLNPVVLLSHDYSSLPVGKVLETTKFIDTDGIKKMKAKIQFAVEVYERAKTVFQLYVDSYMSAFSIGFISKSSQITESADGRSSVRLMDNEMLEISCVAVPANQLALAKSKGLNVDALLKDMPVADLKLVAKELLILANDVLAIKEAPAPVVATKESISFQRGMRAINQAIRSL